MADLAEIDRELEALGSVPQDVAALIDRYGEADRSLQHVDAVLAELAQGLSAGERVSASPDPAEPQARGRRSRGPRDTLVESVAPPPRPAVEEPDLEAETAALLDDGEREAEASDASAAPDAEGGLDAGFGMAELEEESSVFSREELAAMDGDRISEMLQRSSQPPRSPDDAAQAWSDREAPDDGQPHPHAEAGAVDEMEAEAEADDDADFELLVDDEDIIEIDGDELELIEDDD